MRKKGTIWALCALSMIFSVCVPLYAAESADGHRTQQADTVCCAAAPAKAEESPYTKLLKDEISSKDGLFTVRHIKNDWYFEIPDSLLGRLILAVTRFKAVPQGFKMLGGEEVNRSVVYWEAYDEKTIFLREYVKSQYIDPDDRLAPALEQATVDPILHKFEVAGRNPETGARLISVSKWFLGDNKMCGFTSNDRKLLNIGSLVSDCSLIDTMKTYPLNVEVVSLRTYGVSSGKFPAASSGAATVKLNTSMVLLPEEPMQPRFADERVGYFQNPMTQFSDEAQTTKRKAIIQRYRLEPKDPERYRRGQLTEPKKQIVYYIDPATPAKWVPYLKAGIEDWNAAFEAAGFKNAIVARDWPDDPSMSLDDARFSVLRYLPSDTENAYGPRIVDPRSGEIIESHVGWYHNVMNLLKKWYMIQCGPLDERARTMTFDDELMGTLIRFVSSHEVGHTIGLRHNMIASSATPVEKLRDKAWVEKHGHTVSIMDYARFNYVAQPEDKISPKGLFPRIGDYDKWAIRWGYQYRPEFSDPWKEAEVLRSEVTRVLQKDSRMRFVGDEGKGIDPRSQSEDLGDNNMKANEYGLRNLKRVMEHLTEWTSQPDGQYDDLNMMYKSVRAQYQRYVMHVQKNIGGRYSSNMPGEKPYDYMPRAMQKEAIEWMGRNLFTVPQWLYPDGIVSCTGVKPMDEIRERNNTALAFLLAPGMLHNILTASLYASDPYPLDEYLNDVFAAVWKPLGQSDAIEDNFRRQLHRNYLSMVENVFNIKEKTQDNMSVTVSRSDVLLFMENHLEQIEARIREEQAAFGENIEPYRHYASLLRTIGKIKKNYYSE